MNSNQDTKQKEIPILIAGIQVMNNLSLDANTMLNLAHEGLLIPHIPIGVDKFYFKLCINSSNVSPEDHLSEWMYWKSDVEDFKLKHKQFLEDSKQEKADQQNRDADNLQTISVADYINQRRKDGAIDEIIAYELHDKSGTFKLKYVEIARALGLEKGLNENQYYALKQRGRRACEKGKAMLMEIRK